MKVQVCTAVVVMAVLLVGATKEEHHLKFWINFLRGVTSEICGNNLCMPKGEPCFRQMKEHNITTKEELEKGRNNLTMCAKSVKARNADFSTLTLKDVQPSSTQDPAEKAKEIIAFMTQYNVEQGKVSDMLECMLELNGELPSLRACLIETQTNATAENETEDAQ